MFSQRDLHWYAENMDQPIGGAIVFLPGRFNHGYHMLKDYTRSLNWQGVGLVAVTPRLSKGWYPIPISPVDQRNAVKGLASSRAAVERIVAYVCKKGGIARDKVIIVGFSMGAVAGVDWATRTDDPVGAVICHSGAILEPWQVPVARHQMPIVLNHGKDDFCFDWVERYIPMKESLIREEYNVLLAERESGGHQVLTNDITRCRVLFEDILGTDLSWQPTWLEGEGEKP